MATPFTNKKQSTVPILFTDGYFAYAGETTNSRAVFLLSSAHAFTVLEEVALKFKYHLSGKHGRLRVCLDTARMCPFELSGANVELPRRIWKDAKIAIPKGTHLVS